MRVVGGELRVDTIGHAEQFFRAGDVGDIRIGLAREYRIAGQAEHLCPLDFGIPIGALDEPHHDPAVEFLRQRMEPVDGEGGTRAVSLHHDAEAVPFRQPRIGQHALDDVEREVETVGLLGVDVEAHAGVAGRQCQRQQALCHHRQHRLLLRHLIARVQRRQLDRDAVVVADVRPVGAGIERRDRVGIGLQIAQRVGFRAGRLAQHVEGIEIALLDHRATALHRFRDGAAKHELLAHFAHRGGNRLADDRFAETANHGAQGSFDAAFAFVENAAGEHQRPGRRVDEDGTRSARMRRPVVRRDLVGDQFVHGLGVGHPQQRFRQAHQRHALAGRKAVGGKKDLHQPRVGGTANRIHEADGAGRNRLALFRGKVGGLDQPRQGFILVGEKIGTNLLTKGIECGHGFPTASLSRSDGCRSGIPEASIGRHRRWPKEIDRPVHLN